MLRLDNFVLYPELGVIHFCCSPNALLSRHLFSTEHEHGYLKVNEIVRNTSQKTCKSFWYWLGVI